MTLLVVNTTLTAPGNAIDLGTTNDLLVGRNGLAVSTGGGLSGVNGQGDNHSVLVEGTVAGDAGIRLGGLNSVNFGETVLVAATGVVSGTSYGVVLQAFQSSVTNYGLIDGIIGIYVAGNSSIGSRIENAGIIQGTYGVFSAGNEHLTVVNTGKISGTLNSLSGSQFGDSLRNLGQIYGTVLLGDGNDVYDGRGGSVEGTIFGNSADDTFRVGSGIEVIDGGAGIDTLDFRSGGAIKVALDGSFANTRTATDDTYTTIENLIGSRFGNDALAGDGAANDLSGLGGNDTLSGRDGADTLTGGAGADRLVGGLGNDRFVYASAAEGGDTVVQYRNMVGDDDAFLIDAAGFGGGLVAGALAAGQFQLRADHVAQDANDRFIFNTTTHTLWFDVNGSLSGGQTLIATLVAGTELLATDILLT